MSEFLFGGGNGHLIAKADKIAKRHGAVLVNYTEPNGRRRCWFAAPNLGEPFDSRRAKAVHEDIDRAGSYDALLYKQDRPWEED